MSRLNVLNVANPVPVEDGSATVMSYGTAVECTRALRAYLKIFQQFLIRANDVSQAAAQKSVMI